MLDENDLRSGLRALTAAPPPAPADRAQSSARRYRTIRRRRAGAAVAAAFAVAVPVVALAGREPTGPAPVVDLAASMRTWPEHVDGDYRDHTRFAYVTAERAEPGGDVRWLYAGKVPGTSTIAVAYARCGERACTGAALVYKEDDGSPRGNWLVVREEPVAELAERPFGWYFRGARGSVLFALGPAYADRLRYDAGVTRGTIDGDDGVFVGEIGWLRQTPSTQMLDGDRVVLEGALRVPGADRDAIAHAEPLPLITAIPAPYAIGERISGQVGVLGLDGGLHDAPDRGRFRVFVRCVGSGRAIVLAGAETSVQVPCDGEVHAGPPELEGRPGYVVSVSADDPYTTYEVVVGERS